MSGITGFFWLVCFLFFGVFFLQGKFGFGLVVGFFPDS